MNDGTFRLILLERFILEYFIPVNECWSPNNCAFQSSRCSVLSGRLERHRKTYSYVHTQPLAKMGFGREHGCATEFNTLN